MSGVATVEYAGEKIETFQARRLFIASCVALTGSAIMFAVLGDIVNPLKRQFVLTNEQVGWIAGGSGFGFTIGIFLLGPLCDALGMRLLLRFAFLCQAAGVVVMIAAHGFWMLFWGATLHMIGGGTIEAVCNPLIATLYPHEKTRKLNQFHMWFPGGIVIGGVACYLLSKTPWDYWQLKLLIVLIPAVLYAVMFTGQIFPPTERVQSGISFSGMFRETLMRPLFLVLLVCMMMTASLELGPQKWIPSVLQAGGVPGILVLVWITGLMAVMRFFAGPVVAALGNTGLLLVSSILAGTGLLLLSFGGSYVTIALAATIFAFGVCYFWPTMLGTAAERVPNGGALALALLGGTGSLVVSVVTTPLMGKIADHYVHQALVSKAMIAGGTMSNEQQTISVLENVSDAYGRWIQTLGTSGADRIARREALEAEDDANKVLAARRATGRLPEPDTANALRAATKISPSVASGPAAAAADDVRKKVEEVLNPAENQGGLISFRFVAPLSLILIVVFGTLYIQDRRRVGGRIEAPVMEH